MVAPSDSDESRTHSPRGEPSEASGGPKGPPPPMPVSAKGSPPSAAVAGRGAPSGPPPPTPASIMEPPSLGVNPSNGGAVLSATVGEGGVTPPKGGVTPPTIAPNLVPHAKTGTATVAHPGTGEVNITTTAAGVNQANLLSHEVGIEGASNLPLLRVSLPHQLLFNVEIVVRTDPSQRL